LQFSISDLGIEGENCKILKALGAKIPAFILKEQVVVE
jgi:hypothetical protein